MLAGTECVTVSLYNREVPDDGSCCKSQSSGSSHFALGEDGRIYHVDCHKLRFHPRCDVCSAFLPAQPDGLIRFHHAPFWGLRFCPGHEGDGTPRCLACNRLQPYGAMLT